MNYKTNKIKIFHLLNTIEVGGSTNLLISQLKYINYNKFDIHIGFLMGSSVDFKKCISKFFSKKSSIKIHDFSTNKRFSYFSIVKIIRLIKKHDIDIIHTHLIHASIIGRTISLLNSSLKCITTRHYAISKKNKRLINRIEDVMGRYSDATICISDFVKQHLLKLKYSEIKLHTIYNGIDIEKFKSNFNENSIEMKIGLVGRLDTQKGVDILLKSFALILKKHPSLKLDIIGAGPLKKELIKLTANLKISNKVNFLGKISQESVIKKMKTWKIFVLPSRWEAFGLVLIEANALGIPVISTRVEAIPEVIKDNYNGLLIKSEDFKSLALKIDELLLSPEKAKRLVQNGKKILREKFSSEILVKEIESLYIKVLGNNE